jgi:long-subunit fatty acid transport protein
MQRVEQDISGVNVKFGALFNHKDIARFGIAIQSPSAITIDEKYEHSGEAVYRIPSSDFHSVVGAPYAYDLSTPWVFSFGASYAPLEFLRISADLDLRDYSDIEMQESATVDEIASGFNRVVRDQLQSTMNYRVGLEFQVPRTGLILRGGYAMNQSPFDVNKLGAVPDGLNFDNTVISGGVGFIFRDRFIINATYLMSTYDRYPKIYNEPDPATNVAPVDGQFTHTQETITNSALMFSMSYLF